MLSFEHHAQSVMPLVNILDSNEQIRMQREDQEREVNAKGKAALMTSKQMAFSKWKMRVP